METLFKPGDVVVLRTDLSAGMFYPMLEKKEVDGEIYYLPSSDLVTAKAASWEMIDWINKSSFKTATIESIKNGVYLLEYCRFYCEWTDSMLQKANWFIASINNTFFSKLITYADAIRCMEVNTPCTIYINNRYPITIVDRYGIDVKLVNDLTEEERIKIAEVLNKCNKIKTPNKRHKS